MEIGKNIALDADIGGGEGGATCGLRINACGVIDEIGVKARFFDFLGREVAGKLIENCRNHFHVGKFFCTQRSKKKSPVLREKGYYLGL